MAFWKRYQLIGKTQKLSDIPVIKSCRYCGKSEPEASFNTAAHSCPELLGANNFLNFEECDECNNEFSKFESHLSKFFLPYLAVLRVKGKKKAPEFHSRTEQGDELTRTTVRASAPEKLELIVGKDDDVVIDRDRKHLSIRFRLPPHKPLYVYKALVKIGLALLPQENVDQYQILFDWIKGLTAETAYFPIVFITRLNRKRFAQPSAELFECNAVFTAEGFSPELTLIVNFGNLVAQIFLPLSAGFDYECSNQQSPNLEIFPASIIYNQDKKAHQHAKPTDMVTVNYHFTTVELGSDESCIRDEVIDFTFQDIQSSGDANPAEQK